MKYDAVIFDLYGTLVDSTDSPPGMRAEYDAVTVRVAETLGAPLEPFLQKWGATFGERMTGAYPTYEGYVTALCEQLGVVPSPAQVAEALRLRMDLFRARLVPRPDCVATLKELLSMGHSIGLISDCSWETVLLWPEMPLHHYFDTTTFSCAVGMRKPDPRIYAITCVRLGVAPERCLYVGDGGSDELAGAERMGMTALRIHVPYEPSPDAANPWVGPEVTSLSQVLSAVS